MRFARDAEVVNWQGKKIGEVDRVVVDPKTKEVTHLVVRKGHIFFKDKVLPIDRVERAAEDRVELKKGVENAEDLPDFQEIHYVAADDAEGEPLPHAGYAPALAWYYPVPGVAWWGYYPGFDAPYFVRETDTHIPEGTIAIAEGAKVRGSDGSEVGTVEHICTEPTESRVTHIVIVRGLVSKERRLIPVNWLDTVSDDEISLKVSSRTVNDLPGQSKID
jgi:uncharacterized protein YrrD